MLKNDDPLPTGANRLLISFWQTLMKKQDPLLLTLRCDRQKKVMVQIGKQPFLGKIVDVK